MLLALPAASAPWPYSSARLAVLVAVITALMLMSLVAVSVSLLSLQVTLSFTFTLPSLPPPSLLAILTSAVPKLVESVAPSISPPLAAIVKPSGSNNQVPVLPCGARVSTLVLPPIFTRPPEVSTKPPFPPKSPPLALMLPLISVTLSWLSKLAISVAVPPLPVEFFAASTLMLPVWLMLSLAVRRTTPPLLVKPLASNVPLLLIMPPPCRLFTAWADRIISPSGACTALPLSTKACRVEASTRMLLSRLLPSNCNSKASPAAKATVPSWAIITPLLRTSGASKAM